MSCGGYIASKHAISRTIERFIMSQNIKLNKKQKNRNLNKAKKIIVDDVTNKFAVSFSQNGRYKYLYTALKNNACRKYVISLDNKTIITVIDNIKLNDELAKTRLVIVKSGMKIIKIDNFSVSNYIYALVNNNKYLFVVDSWGEDIYSFRQLEGE